MGKFPSWNNFTLQIVEFSYIYGFRWYSCEDWSDKKKQGCILEGNRKGESYYSRANWMAIIAKNWKIEWDNNRKELKGKQLDSNDFRLTYISTARNVGKTRWVLEFFSIMMGRLYEDREAKLSAVALEAYNKVLGPYSSWVIRQGAYIAIQTVPSRESFLKDTKTDYSQIK